VRKSASTNLQHKQVLKSEYHICPSKQLPAVACAPLTGQWPNCLNWRLWRRSQWTI